MDGSSCRRFFADDDSPCFLGVAGSESELEDDVDDDESDRIAFSFYAFPPRLRYFFSNFLTLRFQAVVKSPPMYIRSFRKSSGCGDTPAFMLCFVKARPIGPFFSFSFSFFLGSSVATNCLFPRVDAISISALLEQADVDMN